MLRLQRLRPFLSIVFWLGFWAFIINGAIFLLSHSPPLAWLPERVSGTGFVEDNRQRVMAAAREYAEHRTDASKYLGAIVGISNIREGVNLQVLSNETGPRWQFLGVGGAGGGVFSVKENADVLLDSTLRPDLVILGFTAAQILDAMLPWPSDAAPSLAQQPPSISIESIYSTVRSLSWITTRRQDINLAIEQVTGDAHSRVLKILNIQPTSPDHRSPWREMMRLMGVEHFPEATLRKALATAERKGIFDISALDQSIQAPRMMAELVGEFRARGAEVLVVLTPVHSWWRDREPAGVHKYFQAALEKFLPGERVSVLDYRNAIDDDGFADLVHLNTKGSREFSRILAVEINRFHFNRPPLMNSNSSSSQPRANGPRRVGS